MIETDELEIILLSFRQFSLWLDDCAALENELRCTYDAEPPDSLLSEMEDGEIVQFCFGDVLRAELEKCEKDPANAAFHSFWWIIRKSDRKVIGSCDFKYPPANGETEIGYGLGERYTHHGYMTKAVRALVQWAFEHGVRSVIAGTEVDNTASHAVLTRCGFSVYKHEDGLWWRITN